MYISTSIHHTSYIMLNIRSLAYVTLQFMDFTIEHYFYSIPYNLYIYIYIYIMYINSLIVLELLPVLLLL